MTILARIAGALIVLIGAVAVVAPYSVVSSALATATPRGLVVVAALRMAVGGILLLAARSSRAPKLLRALGALALVAGIATPLLGVARAQALLGWWSARGPNAMRCAGAVAVMIGLAVIDAVTTWGVFGPQIEREFGVSEKRFFVALLEACPPGSTLSFDGDEPESFRQRFAPWLVAAPDRTADRYAIQDAFIASIAKASNDGTLQLDHHFWIGDASGESICSSLDDLSVVYLDDSLRARVRQRLTAS